MNSTHPTATPILPGSTRRAFFPRISLRALELTLFAIFLFLTASQVQVKAQTPTPTPDSDEVQRLKEEKAQSELRKGIAEDRKAELEAKFPKPTTSPLAGETKINEGAVIESEMVSYLSMAYAANHIVDTLKTANLAGGNKINNIAIYNKADIDLLLNYTVTTNQIELVRQAYCKLLSLGSDKCPAPATDKAPAVKLPAAPLSIVSSFLGAFVDLTALLRTNVEVQGHTFNIDEGALVSEVFRAIRAGDGLNSTIKPAQPAPNLYYPAAFPPNLNVNQESELLGQLELLYELKAKVSTIVGGLEENIKNTKKVKVEIEGLEAAVKEIEAKIKDEQAELDRLVSLEKKYGRRMPFEARERMARLRDSLADLAKQLDDTKNELKAKKADLKDLKDEQIALRKQLASDLQTGDLDEVIAKLKLLNDRFDQFIATLIKTDAASGINSLTAYIRAEHLKRVFKDGNSYWLQLAVVKAGGNNRIKTNLLVDIFTGGNRISHSGGTIVQYNLYDPDGKSLVSDTLTEYTGYIKAGKIKRLPNPVKVEDAPDNKARDKPKVIPVYP